MALSWHYEWEKNMNRMVDWKKRTELRKTV